MRARRAVTLSAVSALARIPGFLIPIAVAAFFGAGHSTDAFFLAYSVMLLVGGTSGQAIEVAIVPFAVRALGSGERGTAWLNGTAWRAAGIVGACWLTVLASMYVLSPPGSVGRNAVVVGFALSGVAVGWVVAGVFSGALISDGRIETATGSMLWRGIGAALGLLGIPLGAGLPGLAAGLSLGELLRAAFLRWYVRRPLRLGETIDLPSRSSVLLATGSQAAAGASGAAAALGERLIATSLPSGSLSVLDYATRLLQVPGVVFVGAVAPVLLSRWSRQAVQEGRLPRRVEIGSVVGKAMILAVVLAVAVGLWAPTVVSLVLHHGQFTAHDAASVASLLRWLAVGFVGNVGATMAEQVFIAAAANHWLAVTGVLRGGMRVVIAAALVPTLGLTSMAIGFGIAEWSYLIVLLLLSRRLYARVTGETLPA